MNGFINLKLHSVFVIIIYFISICNKITCQTDSIHSRDVSLFFLFSSSAVCNNAGPTKENMSLICVKHNIFNSGLYQLLLTNMHMCNLGLSSEHWLYILMYDISESTLLKWVFILLVTCVHTAWSWLIPWFWTWRPEVHLMLTLHLASLNDSKCKFYSSLVWRLVVNMDFVLYNIL